MLKLTLLTIFLIISYSSRMFITDFDGTLVHYESETENSKLIELPSSATGRVAYFHEDVPAYLQKIAEFSIVVCASGMREKTMRSRQPFFPSIAYWICENGGKIFHLSSEGKIVELNSWIEYLDEFGRVSGAKEELRRLTTDLPIEFQDHNLKVDSNGYSNMIRVHCSSNIQTIIINLKLPSCLSYTRNLGYLDIQYRCSGKYNAIQFLQHYLEQQLYSRLPYSYMGDDDNDIEALEHVDDLMLILNPHSEAIDTFIDQLLSSNPEHIPIQDSDDTHREYVLPISGKDVDEIKRSRRLVIPLSVTHGATIELLSRYIQWVQTNT
jgi:hydroxymethylpyrimidine pyrophosphatase-like HAD family hydrolase